MVEAFNKDPSSEIEPREIKERVVFAGTYRDEKLPEVASGQATYVVTSVSKEKKRQKFSFQAGLVVNPQDEKKDWEIDAYQGTVNLSEVDELKGRLSKKQYQDAIQRGKDRVK